MKNLHKLYYNDYYNGVKFSLDKDKVKAEGRLGDIVNESKITDNELQTLDFLGNEYPEGFYKSEFQVLYPGLVTGVGIRHMAGVTGEFKLGMHFDYTYGYPVIYGSSVKGVLKSYFKEEYKGDLDVDALIADIFDGKAYSDRKKKLDDRASKPISERDTFFDAIIVGFNGKNNKMIESDAITPHGGPEHTDPFAEPNPISFIKIAPGVRLRFRFKLGVTKDGETKVMSATDKLNLFNKILTTYGIGAKTNVGYGQLK